MSDALPVLDSTLQKTNQMLKDIEVRFGWDDRKRAYEALRGVLQSLRDRLTAEHVAALGAELPMLVRGLYYEGWRPSEAPKKMHKEEFLSEIERVSGGPAFLKGEEIDMEDVAKGVLAVVESHTHPMVIQKIKGTLPKDLREMLGP